MQRLFVSLVSVALVAAAAPAAMAQADAQAAFAQAKTAFSAGDFAKARDLAKKAAETDAKNPEVYLLLGRAHYELGQLDDAVAAWRQTLALAPAEPFATRMLEALRSQRAGADLRIQRVEAMIAEKFYTPAQTECRSLLADKSLSEAQRAKVLTLLAEVFVHADLPGEAEKTLREVLVLYPKQADPIQTTLLLGQAKLRAGGDATAEGLALLKKLIADHASSPAAATARLELATFDLKQGVDQARADALAKWIADNAKHPRLADAQAALLDASLTLSRQGPKPTRDSKLSGADQRAIALVAEMAKQQVRADVTTGLVNTLLKHVEVQYGANQANAAAIHVLDDLKETSLPKPARLAVLKALVQYTSRAAVETLTEEGRAGRLPAAVLAPAPPPSILSVLSSYGAVETEFPAEPLWGERAALAVQIRSLDAYVRWPDHVTALRGPDLWAMGIAGPVVTANADQAAVQTALSVFDGAIQDLSAVADPGAKGLAIRTSRDLIGLLSPKQPAWAAAMLRHVSLLDAYAKYQFRENVTKGNAADNAKLSETQKELLDTLAKLVATDAKQSAAAMKAVGDLLGPWIEQGHWAVAEEAYATLAKALPEADKRQAELAVVRLWIQQVFTQHQRLAAAGLKVPRELDPILKKALVRCYDLQAGLDAGSPKLAEVRNVASAVVAHFESLEYDDVAEAAIKVKAEKPVAAADEYAAMRLVGLQQRQAQRQLARTLAQYGAAEKIALGPEFQAVVAAWEKFITDRPTSPMVPQAAEEILGIGRLFEQHGAYLVAAGVYKDLAQFAAKVKVLSQAAPNAASTPQRAAFAAAVALDAQARKVLAKAQADRKPGDPAPAKQSDEFAAAVGAYQGFIDANPDSVLLRDAIAKVMAVGLEYARIDAWDVAEGVYADLLKSRLAIRRPERLEFARGLCQLGHAIPDHAREVLAALTIVGAPGGEPVTSVMAALAGTKPGDVDGRFFGSLARGIGRRDRRAGRAD